jgi:hypothetical protein
MAYSNSHRPAPLSASSTSPVTASGCSRPQRELLACGRARVSCESGHQLEKLEFALAVAITRGDSQRVDQLRQQIADLGGNREEPGT